jgi:hypothetical protein
MIAAYGGKCQCCGESIPEFLTLDHIDGLGARQRKRLSNGEIKGPVAAGAPFYEWLKTQGWPKDNLRLLCYNCNCARYHNGGVCPHAIR